MKYLSFILLSLLLPAATLPAQSAIPVPDALAGKLFAYVQQPGTAPGLVRELFSRVLGDTNTFELGDDAFLRTIVANVDEEPEPEILALAGRSEYETHLLVIKHRPEGWRLIFAEEVSVWYDPPELNLAAAGGTSKIFYVRQLCERGTGVFSDEYRFFRLIGGNVRPCLTLMNSARVIGWGIMLNQESQAKFQFCPGAEDRIRVSYTYSFFPGAVFAEDAPYDGHPELAFVRGDGIMYYNWDSTAYSYRMETLTDSSELSADKIACMRELGNDTLFVRAFAWEIRQTLAHGSPTVKKLLRRYLKAVKAGETVQTGGGVEKKFESGGMNFYGPKTEKKKGKKK